MNKSGRAYIDNQGQLHQADTPLRDWVWVPTQQITILTLFVPGKRRTQWLAALPYALEEYLAEPLELVHWVPLFRGADGQVTLAVVAKKQMQAWLQALAQADMAQAQLLADCFALPKPSETTCYSAASLTGADYVIVRQTACQGFALAPSLTELVPANDQIGEADSATTEPGLMAYGLRTAEFAPHTQGRGGLTMWRWPVVLAGLVVAMYLAQTAWQTRQLQQQIDTYQQQTTHLFKTLFPQTQRVVNIQVQTQSYLNQFASQADQQGPARLLAQIEPPLLTQKTIKLGRVDWQNNLLSLRLSAPNTQVLEGLVQQLSGHLSVSLQIQQVSAEQAEGVLNVRAK